jgi:phytoene dehydrogenase-like protein
MKGPDAVVVGSGPNGLAGALTLARSGFVVEVIEGARTAGGGCRTEDLTLEGFHHDVCSSVHPLAACSPFFRGAKGANGVTGLTGIRFLRPDVAFAHPLDRDEVGMVQGTVEATAHDLGPDGDAYRRLVSRSVRDFDRILPTVMKPVRSVPDHPWAALQFALTGLQPATRLAKRFSTDKARALFAGAAAHSMLPLSAPLSGAFGLLMTVTAHAVGWPVVEGGSRRITDAMLTELESLGGRIQTGRFIRRIDELPDCRIVLLDITPRQLLDLAGPGASLPARYRRALERFEYGPGVCKVDWALNGPVPWYSDACRRAATVHLGGTFEQIARSELDVAAGRHPERPFCIVVQPSVVDPTRAPEGCQTLWGYCHVPAGSDVDMTNAIESEIERFAPGFRDLVLARATTTAAGMEAHNPNYVGGHINGGCATLRQTLLRPAPRWNPYTTGVRGLYLCSASTPPGGGVHGMCGVGAARSALADMERHRDR